MEDFISSKNIGNYKDCKQIIIRKGMMITPSAKDIARELGIRIIHEEDLPVEQNENPDEGGRAAELSRSEESTNSRQTQDITFETLEKDIERIVRQVLNSKPVLLQKDKPEETSEQAVLMLNFPENRDIEKSVISHIIETGFTIKHLHTFSSSGIQFMILILEDTLIKGSREGFVNSLRDKFPVNVLLS